MTVLEKKLVVHSGTSLEAAISIASHFQAKHVKGDTPKKTGAYNVVIYEVEGETYKAYHTTTTINVTCFDVPQEIKEEEAVTEDESVPQPE